MPQVKKKAETPDTLKPYIFHGVDLNWSKGDDNAVGECPWCGSEKFSVKMENGVWHCWVCAEGNDRGGGNAATFIRMLQRRSFEETSDYSELVSSRKFIDEDTFLMWGVCKSIITDDWLVPAGRNNEGKYNQLYRWIKTPKGFKLLPTPTLGSYMFGHAQYSKNCSEILVCEGPWDAMAIWSILSKTKKSERNLSATSSDKQCLLNRTSVVGIPGVNNFHESWLPLFYERSVSLVFDSDHPKLRCRSCRKVYSKVTHVKCPHCNSVEVFKKKIEPAGLRGMKKVTDLLKGSAKPPTEVNYLKWGEQGYDPDKSSGYDVRDLLTEKGLTYDFMRSGLEFLYDRLKPVPVEWTSEKSSKENVKILPCDNFGELAAVWNTAMEWTEGLDRALSVMLSSIVSTMLVGDQLWIKILGPASCGKSTLCEAVSTNKRYVLAKSTIRGFHSGFGDGTKDHSLASQLPGMTLVTKDGDTLLQSPNLGQVLSEGRDLYDTVSRTSYRNKASKDYSGVRMTWILCGTSSLKSIDSSELGERFLDCVIMEGIDDELEDRILLEVAQRADRNMSIEATGQASSQQDPNMLKAHQMTGGYVGFLRENAVSLMEGIENPMWAIKQCTRFGKFVAYMRSRPSTQQNEVAEREFAARLAIQHTRLAKCLAAVLNKSTVDQEVMRRTRQVALDTSKGPVLDITRVLYEKGKEGMEAQSLAILIGQPAKDTTHLLKFLVKIKALEMFRKKMGAGVRGKLRWRLKPVLHALYEVLYPI